MGTLKLNPNLLAMTTSTPQATYKSPIAMLNAILNDTYPLFRLFLSCVFISKLRGAMIQKI